MKSVRKKILVISFSPLDRDPRVNRQLLFLRSKYKVVCAGFTKPMIDKIEFLQINRSTGNINQKLIIAIRLKTSKFEDVYWSNPLVQNTFLLLKDYHFDLILANDINSLPLAYRLSSEMNAKLFLDSHEFSPREFEDKFKFRFFWHKYIDYICKSYLPHVDAMTTVCDSIAKQYNNHYSVDCNVITNAPFQEKLEPKKVNNKSIRIVHHGGVNPSRKIENMLFLMDHLDERFSLDLILMKNNPKYLQKLYKIGNKNPRIRFKSPVPMGEIAKTTNKYDIGLFLLSPTNFNYKMALPNKLFEFIQARLAVAIWPSPEMAKIVKEYKCGVISSSFSVKEMADIINKLSAEDISSFKFHSHHAASKLCAEKNKEAFLLIIKKLIGD